MDLIYKILEPIIPTLQHRVDDFLDKHFGKDRGRKNK